MTRRLTGLVALSVTVLLGTAACATTEQATASVDSTAPAQTTTEAPALPDLNVIGRQCGISGGDPSGEWLITQYLGQAVCVVQLLDAPAEVITALETSDSAGERSWTGGSLQWRRYGDLSTGLFSIARPGGVLPQVADLPTSGATPSTATPSPPSTQADVDAYVNAEGGQDDPQGTVDAGYDKCSRVRNSNDTNVEDRARDIVDSIDSIGEPEVKYLCKDLASVWAVAKNGFSDGTHEVTNSEGQGTIRAGRYRTGKHVTDCYWERSTRGGDIIANTFVGNAPGGVTVTVRAGEGFKSEQCGAWLPVR